MKLTLTDHLLLARPFIFRSDMNPAECVACIKNLTMQQEGGGFWKGQAFKTRPGDCYEFELYLWRQYIGRGRSSAYSLRVMSQARVQGTIEPGDALGSSVVSGILYSTPRLSLSIAVALICLVLSVFLLLWQPSLTTVQTSLFMAMLIAAILLAWVDSLLNIWQSWPDRSLTIQRLEASLQASYRRKKKKQAAV